MRSRLQLDVCNLSLGRRHLVNAYEVKAGIGAILQVKLCDPCLSALSVKYYKRALYKHLPLPTYFVYSCNHIVCVLLSNIKYSVSRISTNWNESTSSIVHLVQQVGAWVTPQIPLLAVLNVTSHPSTASVSISYYSTWHYNCLCTIKN